MKGCVYTTYGASKHTCVDRTDFTTCTAWANLENLCVSTDACTYNSADGTCIAFDCTDLNDSSENCEGRDSCGHYDYANSVCGDEDDVPAFENDCTNLDGWKVACEAKEIVCGYTVATKKCTTTPSTRRE